MKSPGSSGRFFGLDALRFVAVTLVLHLHAVIGLELNYAALLGENFLDLPAALFPPGSYGVDLFFVLSGFLVSGLLFNEYQRHGTMSLDRFFVRRGLKIYPAFWVMLLVTLLWEWLRSDKINWAGLCRELLFLQNYFPGLWGHTWSLAVEEHFYLLLIVIFFGLKFAGRRRGEINVHRIPRIFDAVLVLCMAVRVIAWWRQPVTDLDYRHGFLWATHQRIDALFFGVWLSYWWHFRWDDAVKAKLRACSPWLLVAGWMLMSAFIQQRMNYTVMVLLQFVVAYLGAGALVLASFAWRPAGAAGMLRGLAWLGRHSYSVYLWHLLVLEWLKPWLRPDGSGWLAMIASELLYHVASWTFGVVAARMIEFPVLRLRDRFFPAC